MLEIETGITGMGLLWASDGEWRLTIMEDGARLRCRVQHGTWIIDRAMPSDVEERLYDALCGIRS